tara:strand:- start:453 stop:965 length:513 start_codon:yes stop_codon:yes gene_type:complete
VLFLPFGLNCTQSDAALGDYRNGAGFNLGDDCSMEGTPSVQISGDDSQGYVAIEDGEDFGFRATVEAGSDIELSLRLRDFEPNIFSVDIQIQDGGTLLAESQFEGLESYCLADGDHLIPSLVLSFGSLGLIDLEGRLVSIVATLLNTSGAGEEEFSDQVEVELISQGDEI